MFQQRISVPETMADSFGRKISYLRLSLTDRCNFRCYYCMNEDMSFLPEAEVLTLAEIERLCGTFIALGTRKLRLTGGEPLVRPGAMDLIRALGRHVRTGALDELTLTTNGSLLSRHAETLAEAGVRRINVSLDTLNAEKFRTITRRGSLPKVLDGIDAARQTGLRVKINMVALKGINDDEFHTMVEWCGTQGFDLTFIEVMPIGELGAVSRQDQYIPLPQVRAELERRWTLDDSTYRSGGPARYATVRETGRRIGFISPLTHSFCETCNRVRLTCTGALCLCLGQEDAADLRTPLRASSDDAPLIQAIRAAVARKPKGHDFVHGREQTVRRFINVTGG